MELVFLAFLFILMMYALGSGFQSLFLADQLVTIALAEVAGYLIEPIAVLFIQDGPFEWLTAGVINFRGIYWEVERDTLIAIPFSYS